MKGNVSGLSTSTVSNLTRIRLLVHSWNKLLVPPLESSSNYTGKLCAGSNADSFGGFEHSISLHCADEYSKNPCDLGLQSAMQDCTTSVPPLADMEIDVASRALHSACNVAGRLSATSSSWDA